MEDDLADKWKSFSLSEVEQADVGIQDSLQGSIDDHKDYCLIFSLLTRKFFNKEAFKSVMRTVWSPVKGVKFFDLGENVFLAQFADQGDKKKVCLNSPWSFNKNLVLLMDYVGDVQSSRIKMHFASFWVRLYDLPLMGMNSETARSIGESIGNVEDIDLYSQSPGWGVFLRVRIRLDVCCPLPSVKRLCLRNGEVLWVHLKYERLPNFCYYCGKLGHSDRDCELWVLKRALFEKDGFPYGVWLRAEGRNSTNGQRKSFSRVLP
ncbi:hypothetical protein F2P56_014388 [Juglans regia]|uniref:CCHC-type domain-containing protein n=2 Tax=Juglans regia TaxID=51240 RepID=A0A834CTW1_JUGRE|nr:uncharacterized protein At4g02000-like [Juglans regia]KAF5464301.1 hypothetical protein F2P56_014388 [Juglans regia]